MGGWVGMALAAAIGWWWWRRRGQETGDRSGSVSSRPRTPEYEQLADLEGPGPRSSTRTALSNDLTAVKEGRIKPTPASDQRLSPSDLSSGDLLSRQLTASQQAAVQDGQLRSPSDPNYKTLLGLTNLASFGPLQPRARPASSTSTASTSSTPGSAQPKKEPKKPKKQVKKK